MLFCRFRSRQQRNAIAHIDPEIEGIQYRCLFGVANGGLLQHEDWRRQIIWRRELNSRRPPARHVGDWFHALQQLDTALRLARLLPYSESGR